MVGQYVDNDHRTWDEHLPALQFAFNTAVHDATGYTPAFLNHGRELTPPISPDTPTPPADEPDAVRRKLAEAYELVRITLARAFHRQQHYYDLRRRPWKPKLGEWVWKREHPLSKKSDNFNAKLAPKYSGPYEVRKFISPVITDLRSKRGKWHKHIHIQDLKPASECDKDGELQNIAKGNNINLDAAESEDEHGESAQKLAGCRPRQT